MTPIIPILNKYQEVVDEDGKTHRSSWMPDLEEKWNQIWKPMTDEIPEGYRPRDLAKQLGDLISDPAENPNSKRGILQNVFDEATGKFSQAVSEGYDRVKQGALDAIHPLSELDPVQQTNPEKPGQFLRGAAAGGLEETAKQAEGLTSPAAIAIALSGTKAAGTVGKVINTGLGLGMYGHGIDNTSAAAAKGDLVGAGQGAAEAVMGMLPMIHAASGTFAEKPLDFKADMTPGTQINAGLDPFQLAKNIEKLGLAIQKRQPRAFEGLQASMADLRDELPIDSAHFDEMVIAASKDPRFNIKRHSKPDQIAPEDLSHVVFEADPKAATVGEYGEPGHSITMAGIDPTKWEKPTEPIGQLVTADDLKANDSLAASPETENTFKFGEETIGFNDAVKNENSAKIINTIPTDNLTAKDTLSASGIKNNETLQTKAQKKANQIAGEIAKLNEPLPEDTNLTVAPTKDLPPVENPVETPPASQTELEAAIEKMKAATAEKKKRERTATTNRPTAFKQYMVAPGSTIEKARMKFDLPDEIQGIDDGVAFIRDRVRGKVETPEIDWEGSREAYKRGVEAEKSAKKQMKMKNETQGFVHNLDRDIYHASELISNEGNRARTRNGVAGNDPKVLGEHGRAILQEISDQTGIPVNHLEQVGRSMRDSISDLGASPRQLDLSTGTWETATKRPRGNQPTGGRKTGIGYTPEERDVLRAQQAEIYRLMRERKLAQNGTGNGSGTGGDSGGSGEGPGNGPGDGGTGTVHEFGYDEPSVPVSFLEKFKAFQEKLNQLKTQHLKEARDAFQIGAVDNPEIVEPIKEAVGKVENPVEVSPIPTVEGQVENPVDVEPIPETPGTIAPPVEPQITSPVEALSTDTPQTEPLRPPVEASVPQLVSPANTATEPTVQVPPQIQPPVETPPLDSIPGAPVTPIDKITAPPAIRPPDNPAQGPRLASSDKPVVPTKARFYDEPQTGREALNPIENSQSPVEAELPAIEDPAYNYRADSTKIPSGPGPVEPLPNEISEGGIGELFHSELLTDPTKRPEFGPPPVDPPSDIPGFENLPASKPPDPPARAWTVKDWYDATRSMFSGDNSFPMNQGAHTAMTNPSIWFKGLIDSYRAMSPEMFAADQLKLREHPRYQEAVDAGVLRDSGVQEFTPQLMEHAPGVGGIYRASSRAFEAASNRMRLELFDRFMKRAEAMDFSEYQPEGDPATTDNTYQSRQEVARKKIAEYVKTKTGTGEIPTGLRVPAKSLSGPLAGNWALKDLFNAPSYKASQITKLNPLNWIGPEIRDNGAIQKYKRSEGMQWARNDIARGNITGYAVKGATATATIVASLKGLLGKTPSHFITDPTDVDFGGIKIGKNVVVHPGDVSDNLVRMIARVASGTSTSGSGKVTDKNVAMTEILRFIQSTLHPAPEMAVEMTPGARNYVGEDPKLPFAGPDKKSSWYPLWHALHGKGFRGERFINQIIPLAPREMWSIAEQDDIPIAARAALATYAFHGGKVYVRDKTYMPAREPRSRSSSEGEGKIRVND